MASRWRSVMACRGSSGSDHSGTPAGASRSSTPVTDQQADDGVQHRLGHRPAEQAGLRRHRIGRPVEVLRAGPGSARPRWRRHGRRRRRGWWRGARRRRTPRRAAASSASATLGGGGSAWAHAVVGHGTPAGCGGSGTRSGSAGLTGSGSPGRAHRVGLTGSGHGVSCPRAPPGWRRAGPPGRPRRRTAPG